jgi:hypothetical protein
VKELEGAKEITEMWLVREAMGRREGREGVRVLGELLKKEE